MQMQDKVIVITGGGSGIGRATALKFAREGAKIVIADNNIKSGMETVNLIKNEKGYATFIKTDVANFKEVEQAVDSAVDVYGKIDIMFNNAGIGEVLPLLDHDPGDYDRVVKVNQYGVYYGILAAGRKMKSLGIQGVIVNTASVFAFMGSSRTFSYNASKAAVKMMTQCAAVELAQYGIRVIAVAPGYVDTPIHTKETKKREEFLVSKHMRNEVIRPENIADSVYLLCLYEAKVINGSTILLDDGYTQYK